MTCHDIAELVSLAMTSPTVILSAAVVYVWWPQALQSLKRKGKEPSDWFIMGVAIGFVGAMCDNVYWSMPWAAEFLDSPWEQVLFDSGVYFNIPFRQTCGILSAYCHIRSAIEHGNRRAKVEVGTLVYLIGISCLIGLVLTGWLVWVRHK